MSRTARQALRPGSIGRVVYVAIAVAASIMVGYLVATDPAPYERVISELRFPAAWVVPHADVEQRSLLFGSHVTRFYLVDADPDDTAPVVERVVSEAGFTLDRSYGPTCHRNPSAGPIETCTVAALREGIYLWIVAHARGKLVSPSFRGDEPGVGAPNLSVIRVQAGSGY